jgi:hypothetical protein
MHILIFVVTHDLDKETIATTFITKPKKNTSTIKSTSHITKPSFLDLNLKPNALTS